MSEIEVTLHVTSYNRPKRLRACIDSFFQSSTYDMSKLELIIVDNGSTDLEVKDYIQNLQPPCQNYHYILNPENDYPSCLRFAKIQAREIALGNYFIDCPDDHLFLVRSDWVEKSIAHLDRDKSAGCVVHFAQPSYRFFKENNRMSLHEDNPGIFRSYRKGYADYHVMRRDVYESLGPYDYKRGRQAEDEYMDRALDAGYHRNLMKYPVAFINDDSFRVNRMLSQEEYEAFFLEAEDGKEQELPVSNEQMISLGTKLGILEKSQP